MCKWSTFLRPLQRRNPPRLQVIRLLIRPQQEQERFLPWNRNLNRVNNRIILKRIWNKLASLSLTWTHNRQRQVSSVCSDCSLRSVILFHWFLSTPFGYLQWDCSITNQLDILCPPFCGTCLVFFFPPTLRSCWVSPSAEKQRTVGSVREHFTPF